MSTSTRRGPAGGVGSNQYQTRGRSAAAAVPGRVAAFRATRTEALPASTDGMHIGRTPSGRIVATSAVVEVAGKSGDIGTRYTQSAIAERVDGTWAVAVHEWALRPTPDGARVVQSSTWAHTTDPDDPNATIESGKATYARLPHPYAPDSALAAAENHHSLDMARTRPGSNPTDDGRTIKCPRCGECLDCNTRGCRNGGPHLPARTDD